MIDVAQLCEIIMLCTFGASWPFNIAKSIRSRTAKGKSVQFEILVVIGYCFGLYAKIWTYMQTGVLAYSTWFYIADIFMVCIDIVLYVRNTRLDRIRDAAGSC
jgi:multidrug transporter EmrE-like cation transporter